MILQLTVDGRTFPIPPHFVSTLRVCPRRILDGLPLEEIEEYVKQRSDYEESFENPDNQVW